MGNVVDDFLDNINRAANTVSEGISSIGKSFERSWRDAGRGEVGKYVAGSTQGIYNAGVAAHRAIATGQYGKEAQKLAGSYANIKNYGIPDYAGRSSGVQAALRSKYANNLSLGFAKNVAGSTRGASTLMRDGKISNEDRNDYFQGGVKVGAVVGGAMATNYLTGYFSGAKTAVGTKAVASKSTASALTTSKAAAVGTAAAPASTAAAAVTPWSRYGTDALLGASLLKGGNGGQAARDYFGIPDLPTQYDPSDLISNIGNLLPRGNSGPSEVIVRDPAAADSGNYVVPGPGNNMLILAALGVGVFFLAKRFIK